MSTSRSTISTCRATWTAVRGDADEDCKTACSLAGGIIWANIFVSVCSVPLSASSAFTVALRLWSRSVLDVKGVSKDFDSVLVPVGHFVKLRCHADLHNLLTDGIRNALSFFLL
jgi:hypothetical protein